MKLTGNNEVTINFYILRYTYNILYVKGVVKENFHLFHKNSREKMICMRKVNTHRRHLGKFLLRNTIFKDTGLAEPQAVGWKRKMHPLKKEGKFWGDRHIL